MGEFDKELKAMNAAWSGAPESSDLPEGTYTMIIQEAKLARSKSNGKLRAAFRYVVSEGEHRGSSQFDGFQLDPEDTRTMSRLKTFLGKKLGYEIPPTMQGVEEILADITARNPIVLVQLQKSKKSDYMNIYVQEVLGAAEGADVVADADADADAPAAEDTAPEGEEASEAAPELGVGVVVEFESGGEKIQGKITEDKGDNTYTVETETDVYADVDASLLTPVATEDAPADDEPAPEPEAEADDAVRTGLMALAQAYGLKVKDSMTAEDLTKMLRGYEWKASDLTDDEVEVLKAVSIPVMQSKPTAKPVAKTPAKPVAASKPASKPVSKPVSKPTAKPVSKPAAKAGAVRKVGAKK